MNPAKRSHPGTTKKRRPIYRRPIQAPTPDTIVSGPGAYPTQVRLLAYGPDSFEEKPDARPDELALMRRRFPVVWVDVMGVADVPCIEEIAKQFDLHPLSVEDVVHTHQRAKVEDYGTYHFIVIRMAPLPGEHETEQLAMFLGDGFVITFQERPGDDLEPVRHRIRNGLGRIRTSGPDYLMYVILDTAVDAYFPLLEKNGSELEDLEDDIITAPGPDILKRAYTARRALLGLRRGVWPLRETMGTLIRDDSPRFSPETRVFLRDVYDHSVQIIDLMETYRELSTNLMDVYLSSMNNRMSEVMKVLTIITTIFIPLSFIAGVYGMNFDPDSSRWNMPELRWKWSYPTVLAVMAVIAVALIAYFRRRGWIGNAGGWSKPE